MTCRTVTPNLSCRIGIYRPNMAVETSFMIQVVEIDIHLVCINPVLTARHEDKSLVRHTLNLNVGKVSEAASKQLFNRVKSSS